MSVPKASDSIWASFLEGSRFFMKEGAVHIALRRLAERLEREHVDYAIVGGMALVAHGYRRFTEGIDLLMTPESLERFRESCLGRGYVPTFPGARKSFRDAETGVRFEREGLWIIALEPLLELKLASGSSATHRLRDLADVQDLIRRLDLPLETGDRLDPSVREAFRNLWKSTRSDETP